MRFLRQVLEGTQQVVGPSGCAKAEEQPRALEVPHLREPLQEALFRRKAACRMGLEELGGANRGTQHDNAALCGRPFPPPHLGSETGYARGGVPALGIPAAALAEVRAYTCVLRDGLRDRVERGPRPPGPRKDVHVVQECTELLAPL